MFEIRRTDEFDRWFEALEDGQAIYTIASRIERLRFGNFGDAKPVGRGVTELRIHAGPGYRIYVTQRGRKLVIVLGGGTKRRQDKDIAAAQDRASRISDDEEA